MQPTKKNMHYKKTDKGRTLFFPPRQGGIFDY